MLFKFVCLPEHDTESYRPNYLVMLLQVFGFSFQMSRAQLVCLYRGLKVRFPAIMSKYSKNIDLCYQPGIFLCLHQNDALQVFDDYLIRCFHILYCKAKSGIQYIKEHNRLVINSHNYIC